MKNDVARTPCESSAIEQYNDRLSAIYDAATRDFQWTPPTKALALLKSALKPGLSILDIGIGTAQEAGELLEAGCHVCGVDLSATMLTRASQKYPQLELHKADV